LPADILYRRKMGFAVPLAVWFRGPLRSRVSSLSNSEALLDSGLFAPAAIRELVKLHQTGVRDYSAALWTLLMFESFMRQSVHERAAPQPARPASFAQDRSVARIGG
jgi:asparagine synthase (glutamine-hydrolysing)